MAERFVYSTGTISIANGASAVTGIGTAWGGRDRAGSQIIAIPPAAVPFIVGIVAEVDPRGIYDDLELPLVAPYNGATLTGVVYRLVDGPAIANGASQAAIYARFNANLEQNMGLAGNDGDSLDMSLVPNNSLIVDHVTGRLKQWRSGSFEFVTSGADGIDGASAFTIVRVVDIAGLDPATAYEAGDTVDGTVLAANDLVLRAKIAADALNGVYVVPASGAASRAAAFAAYDDLPGRYFSIMEGAAGNDTLYRCTSNKGGTLGATVIAIEEYKRGVRFDVAQSLTAAQKSQARSNIDVERKNYVINGAMMVSQEKGSSAGTTDGFYAVDQFRSNKSIVGTGVVSLAQVASPSPAGSPNRIRATVTTAQATIGADYYSILTSLEGYRVADLQWGTIAAKNAILRVGVKAPAGTYLVSFFNDGFGVSIGSSFVISGGEANTDVYKDVQITAPTSGTWKKDNAAGIHVVLTLAATGQFNLMGTNGNVFELFDVGLYEGSVAPAFKVPDYASELQICKRYWRKNTLMIGKITSTTTFSSAIDFNPPMRSSPTVAVVAGTSGFAEFGVAFRNVVSAVGGPTADGGAVDCVISASTSGALGGVLPGALSANARL